MNAIQHNDVSNNDWIRERIKDILKERSLKVRQFARMANMKNHMVLQRYLDGTNYITPSALEQIASGFKISVDRLMKTDTTEMSDRLKCLLTTGENPKLAVELAERIVGDAVGYIEKIEALKDVGKAYYALGMNEKSQNVWEKVREKAECLDDDELVFEVSMAQAHILFSQKNLYGIAKILHETELRFNSHTEKMGKIHHFRAVCAFECGDMETAKTLFLKSYDHYKRKEDLKLLGRIEHNIGNVEFMIGNLVESELWFEKATRRMQSDNLTMQTIFFKDYARTLELQGKAEKALEIVNDQLGKVYDHHDGNLIGKLLFLKAKITGDLDCCERIFELKNIGDFVKGIAADFLVERFIQLGDCISTEKYYKILKGIGKIPNYKQSGW